MPAPILSPCNFSQAIDVCFADLNLGSLQDTNLGWSKFPIYFFFANHISRQPVHWTRERWLR